MATSEYPANYVANLTSDAQTQFNAKVDKHVFSPTLTDLTVNGALYTFFYHEISANASFSFSNLTVGVLYRIQVKNTHATDTITLTLPNTSSWVVSSGLTTCGLPAGYTQPFEVIYDGTKYRMWIGTAMKVMG